MSNPWLEIPLADYEGHMAAPEVQQAEALSAIFAEVLALRQPASIAILGIAGGSGLDRIDPCTARRIVGIDINPAYLDVTGRRFPQLPQLELVRADLAQEKLSVPPVQLVHAAMIFEHAGTARCLENAISLVASGGSLSVVLQLPSEETPSVGKTGFSSLRKLDSHFIFVDPAKLRHLLEQASFTLNYEKRYPLVAGKAFWMGIFDRTSSVSTAK